MPAVALPPTPPVLVLAPYQSADWILSQMPDGGRVVGLQKGQASLTDLAVAAAERLGRGARVVLFSWGMSLEDLALLQRTREDGRTSLVQIQLDAKRAGEERFGAMVASFGAENVTTSAMHAEVAAVLANGRAIVIRGSMGNNRNAQFQQFDVEESTTAAELVLAHLASPQRGAKFPQAKTEPGLAAAALRGLDTGRVFGLSAGFSLAALIQAALGRTGPADVEIVTWSSDEKNIAKIQAHPNARAVRLIVGSGFHSQEPERCRAAADAVKPEHFRIAQSHAKIVIVRNDRHAIVIRGSQNLTANPRAENFDAEDSPAIADFFAAHAADVFAKLPVGAFTNHKPAAKHFERALGGGLALDAYAERDQRPTSNGDRIDMAALTQAPKPYAADTLAALMAPPRQLTLL
jgi:hypothetical protein